MNQNKQRNRNNNEGNKKKQGKDKSKDAAAASSAATPPKKTPSNKAVSNSATRPSHPASSQGAKGRSSAKDAASDMTNPMPLLVLSGTSSPITAIQFISPALRIDDLSASHSQLLQASFCDGSDTYEQSVDLRPYIIKPPPPGFLMPTSYVAAGTQDGKIIIWDLMSKQSILSFVAHKLNASVITLKSISPSELISYGRGDSVKLWILSLGEPPYPDSSSDETEEDCFKSVNAKAVCIAEITLAEYTGFSGIDIFKHFNCLTTAVPGPTQDAVTVWDLNSVNKISDLIVEDYMKVGSVMHLKWIERKRKATLLAAYESGDILLWNWGNSSIYSSVSVRDNPICLEYDQTLSTGILGTVSEKVYVFSIDIKFHIHIQREINITNGGIGACVSRPDSKLFVTGGWDHRIRVYTWHKYQPLCVLTHHQRSISCLHYSSSNIVSYEAMSKKNLQGTNHMLAAGSSDGSVSIWKLY